MAHHTRHCHCPVCFLEADEDHQVTTSPLGITHITPPRDPVSVVDKEEQRMSIVKSTPKKGGKDVLAEQCAVISRYVEKGHHLAALIQALDYSCAFTFARDPSEVFSARIHVYSSSTKEKAPGIQMQFRRELKLSFRAFLARRLLRGVLIRYPKGYFPRRFMVVEGDNIPILLYNVNARCSKNEQGRNCHDLIVQQWLEARGRH
ncbi:hypothetical protein E0Z10_g3274 [Xylaria hypoxylon]|uniref:Uncharacterized protein n=1 Tax=Xylaria hypoxylon TaxID=37992 RepID=A0A4Z0YNL2_9PEZI|nr:hypothetical protein E0Z10_g3274 [Xylaria hypoxylon]